MEMQPIPEVIVLRVSQNEEFECLATLPTLDQNNLMKSIKNGKIEEVECHLKGAHTKEFRDNMGVSYIEEAVQAGKTEVLEVLLNKARGENVLLEIINQALLYAIKHDNHPIVEYILNEHRVTRKKIANKPSLPPLPAKENALSKRNVRDAKPKQKPNKNKTSSWRKKDRTEFEDAEFPMYMSPTILACQLERIKILDLLLRHDDDDIGNVEIHPVSEQPCPLQVTDYRCEVCFDIDFNYNDIIQPLEDSLRILEVYKALASPAYILSRDVEDPILECFKLRKALLKLSRRQEAFKSEYKELAAQCSRLAQELVSLCRDPEEVEMCLAFDGGIEEIIPEPETIPLKRIAVALYYEEKQFIGHFQIQYCIHQRWLKGLWGDYRNRTQRKFYCCLFWQIIGMALFFPFFCLVYSFVPCVSCVQNFMNEPVNKYINATISKLLFICILIADIQSPGIYSPKIGCVFSIREVIVAVWVFGMWCRVFNVTINYCRSRAKFSWRFFCNSRMFPANTPGCGRVVTT